VQVRKFFLLDPPDLSTRLFSTIRTRLVQRSMADQSSAEL